MVTLTVTGDGDRSGLGWENLHQELDGLRLLTGRGAA
jgi:hypothetical protein